MGNCGIAKKQHHFTKAELDSKENVLRIEREAFEIQKREIVIQLAKLRVDMVEFEQKKKEFEQEIVMYEKFEQKKKSASHYKDVETADGVVRALKESTGNIFDKAKAISALALIQRLVFQNPDMQKELGEKGACTLVILILVQHLDSTLESIEVCEKGLTAVVGLCRHGFHKNTSNEYNLTAFLEAGACEAVVSSLLNYSTNAVIVAQACRAIHALSISSHNCSKLGSVGGCEAVLVGLQAHKKNEDLVEHALKALFNLSGDEGNRVKLGNVGTGEIVLGLLSSPKEGETRPFEVSYINSAPICTYSCAIIANLALEKANKHRLGEAGACKAVVAVLKSHAPNASVMEYATLAVSCLGDNSVENTKKLGNAHACEHIVWVLHKHAFTSSVVENACMAIMNLAIVDSNNIRLGNAGACEAVMEGFNTAHGSREAVARQATMAIVNLAVAVANREMLGHAGACKAVVSHMLAKIKIPVVAQQSCMAINNLSANHSANKTKLSVAGASEVVLAALKFHSNDHGVLHHACGAVKNLATVPENNVKLGSIGACETVVDVVTKHIRNAIVVEKACMAIEILAADKDNKAKLISAGAYDRILAAARAHATNITVARLATRAANTVALSAPQASKEHSSPNDAKAADPDDVWLI